MRLMLCKSPKSFHLYENRFAEGRDASRVICAGKRTEAYLLSFCFKTAKPQYVCLF